MFGGTSSDAKRLRRFFFFCLSRFLFLLLSPPSCLHPFIPPAYSLPHSLRPLSVIWFYGKDALHPSQAHQAQRPKGLNWLKGPPSSFLTPSFLAPFLLAPVLVASSGFTHCVALT